MSKKAIKITELVLIALFFTVVLSVASILIYRAVINSDWYGEMQAEDSFAKMKEKINKAENIDYITVEYDNAEHSFHNVPAELFDDISCDSYKRIDNNEEQRKIFRGSCITVFYKDKSYTVFFVEGEKLYWEASLEIRCPSLINLYRQAIE